MSDYAPVPVRLLATGVPGLDDVLGGGLPEYSFNLITGSPGAGKTTLVHQLMFANAAESRTALYFTVMGEPPLKMLRHQQQFHFFDPTLVGTRIQFIDLSDIVQTAGLRAVLERIIHEVESTSPELVVVDSFQAIVRVASAAETGQLDLQEFVQRLAVHLTNWQATTFLIGELLMGDLVNSPLLTVADGILTLSQQVERNSVVRKLQVVKLRGLAPMPGVHTLRITAAGLQVFPRMRSAVPEALRARPTQRAASGVAGLDALVGGGFPQGDAVLISGPSGVGKSVLATQFIAAGIRDGAPGVIAVFEEHPAEYVARAASLGVDLAAMEQQGQLRMIYIRPLDLSPDETLYEIQTAAADIGAQRVVIDSVSGFELALAPSFRDDFRESLYRLVGALTGTGITVLLTMEIVQSSADLRLSPYIVSFLADDIVLLRYVELGGTFLTSLAVIKMRNSAHSHAVHRYEVTDQGMIMRDRIGPPPASALAQDAALIAPGQELYAGLTPLETLVLQALIELGESQAEAIAQRVGVVDSPLLHAALERLVQLAYAVRLDTPPPTRYRALARERS